MQKILCRLAQESDQHSLDDQLTCGNQVWEIFVFRVQVRPAVFHHVAFQGRFTIDQRRHDIAIARFAELHDHHITIANVRIHHRFATHLEGESPRRALDSQRADVNGKTAFFFRSAIVAEPCGNATVDGHVHNFLAVQLIRKRDGAGFSGQSLNRAFFLQSAKMTHRGRLTRKAEIVLQLTRGRHDPRFALCGFEIR
jgi:hypothetical protein